ncbi:TldD/PmbA family protein [Coprothermobacter platensis]|uniref:TldD/PmbA family protein n=1 Tax=Coprothermobacter platensis TaxID=108819 RepID=UPI000370DEBB|nr:TldD/PmbA family protein [Coprothermobacter platensis]
MDFSKYVSLIAKNNEAGDIFYSDVSMKSVRIGCVEGQPHLEDVSSKEVSGYGIRVIKDGRMGFSFGNKTDDESILQSIEYASQAAELGEPLNISLPSTQGNEVTELKSESDINEILDRISEIYLSKRITKFEATAERESSKWLLTNTSGAHIMSSEEAYSVTVMPVVSGIGENANYWFAVTLDPENLDINELVLRSLDRAYSSLDGKGINLKGIPVVFDAPEWAELWSFLLDSFSGKNVERGKSFFSGKLSQRVLSDHLSIKLENNHPKVPGNFLYDNEGVNVQPVFLVEEGAFVQAYYGLASAAEFGKVPTGVGRRFSFETQPLDVPFICHFQIEGLPTLESLDKYLLVTSLKGIHSGLNAVSGAFSIGADGVLLDGEKHIPVSGVTLSGNIWDVLNQVIAASDKEEAIPSGSWVVSPLVALDGITISG